MKHAILRGGMVALALSLSVAAGAGEKRWKIHDLSRPKPPVVTPPAQNLPTPVPPDAVVLFDGKNLSEFASLAGGPAKWTVKDGALIVAPGTGHIVTKRAFGDVQVHLEWASPNPATGRSQGRGNSGIHLMGLYEVQILDSYQADTYADGQAAALYGQFPPLVNACRPPGEWQSYDIVFRRPRFDARGKLLKPARVTVIHNGVLVQDNVELLGPTIWLHYRPYKAHADKLPFSLQEHGNPVRYRNIWVRELGEPAKFEGGGPETAPKSTVAVGDLKRFVGTYKAQLGQKLEDVTVTLKKGRLFLGIPVREQSFEMIPLSPTEFTLRTTDARVVFKLDTAGKPTAFDFGVGEDVSFTARRP